MVNILTWLQIKIRKGLKCPLKNGKALYLKNYKLHINRFPLSPIPGYKHIKGTTPENTARHTINKTQ